VSDDVSEWVEDMRALKEHRKEERRRLGVPCPQCAIARPKAHASILLPCQRCRVDGYRDPRPREDGHA
jgi:hypothetical protein